MRAACVLGLVALAWPAAVSAQTAAAPAATAAVARRGGDITRDQYIERARRNAERRFDRMDADHDGVLTAAERRAYREAHRRRRASAAPAPNPPPK
jgi:hypothetical protein